jgi:ribonuclease
VGNSNPARGTDQKTIDAVLAARGNPGRVAAELLADPSIRSGNAANLRAVRDRVVRMAEIRQQPLTGFGRSQQQRLVDKLSDIEHVRNGHPAPSGNWHARDGIPFQNREGLLPPSTKGYTEYRVPGSDGRPSGARIVVNEDNGRVFYSEHYGDDGSGFTEVINLTNKLMGK